jgi:hypothetical protein
MSIQKEKKKKKEDRIGRGKRRKALSNQHKIPRIIPNALTILQMPRWKFKKEKENPSKW